MSRYDKSKDRKLVLNETALLPVTQDSKPLQVNNDFYSGWNFFFSDSFSLLTLTFALYPKRIKELPVNTELHMLSLMFSVSDGRQTIEQACSRVG